MAKHSENVVRHLGRNDACWCGSGRKYKACHAAFDDKLKKYSLMGKITPDHSILKTPEQVAKIKESCAVNIAILDRIEKEIHEGMATSEIDKIVYDMSVEAGGIPAPLNYEGYPYSVCTSVNEQVCHGFPSDKVILKSGDIVNVDCSTILNGFFSDSSRMFCIGEVSEEKQRLVKITREACYEGLKYCKPWGFLGDVGQAVHVGYHSKKGTDMLLVPGMIFTIEPMVNMGKEDIVTDKDNGWEVSTKDGKPSAQWEIMVLITEEGNEVLCW